jgi:hypothetical protein
MSKLLFGIDVVFDRDWGNLDVSIRLADRDGALKQTWHTCGPDQTLTAAQVEDIAAWFALSATHALFPITCPLRFGTDESRSVSRDGGPADTDRPGTHPSTWTDDRSVGHHRRL